MKQFFKTKLVKSLLFLSCLWPMIGTAAPFTPGNIVVMRVGDGTASLSSAATAAYLQEYTPAGVLVQTIPLPTAVSGNNRILTVAGSSSTDGGLTRSANGAYLVMSGYDAAPGLAAVAGVAPATTNRIVGRIGADGTIDTSTRLDDASGNLRSAASVDGSGFYTSGSGGGVRYVALGNTGNSVVVSGTPSNLRYVNTFGGNLYVSSGSSPFIGISQVGTGLPTTSGQTTTLLPGMQGTTSTTNGISPLAFYFADLSTTVPGVDVVYVADDGATTAGGGIQKWSLVGSTWTLNGTITNSVAVRGLDGMTNGTTVSLVASGNGGLYILSDNAGYNAAPSTTALPAAIATAGSMTAFRGAAFAPVAAVAAPTITSFTPATGAAGTTVTITGTGFTGATAVTLNGVAITGFTVVNATTITFAVPATATSGAIGVTTPGGTVASTGTFTFVPAATAPTITSFTPTSGTAGATVTITGTNLTGATAVTLNGVAITGFTVVNGTTITFTVPATGVTSGTIAVTTPGGTATSTGTFTVTPAAVTPTITQLAPGVQVVGGAAVTFVITGTGFTPTSTVNFNGVSYSQTTSTATSIEALIPASAFTAAGSYPVTVTNAAGTSNAFTFTVNNPSTAGAFENFETGTKTGYTAGTVVLASGTWTFSDALIGNAFNDRANGLKSARIRVGFIRMDFDKPNGAGTVIVNAGSFGNDPAASFILEKSTDGGTTFTTVPGAPATITNVITPYTFTVNQTGNVRFRITSTSTVATSRINIDDITINGYTGTATLPSQALAGLSLFPNPATDRITVELPTAGAAMVALRDLTGRLVLAPAALAADKQLRLPVSLAKGVYMLEVSQNGVNAVRRIEKN